MRCDAAVFDQSTNVFLKSNDTFFEMVAFGGNAVFWADEQILGWCADRFICVPAGDIIDGKSIFAINDKLRSFGKGIDCRGRKERYACLLYDVECEHGIYKARPFRRVFTGLDRALGSK